MSAWEEENACPVCGEEMMVFPSGLTSSPILIIGDAPGDEEIKSGRPFIGRTGTILSGELGRLGIDLKRIRVTNMWLHAKTDNEKCLQHGMSKAIEEAIGKRLILLIGASTVKKFCGHGVEDHNGLLVTSPLLSAQYIMASVQPTMVWNPDGVVGEVKLVIKRFADIIEREDLL